MSRKTAVITLALATMGVLSGAPAWSQATDSSSAVQSTSTQPEVKLAAQYSALAGSQRNADSLITGLRDGRNILLVSDPAGPNPTAPSVTFTPATGKLGYGNINIALSLAKADLSRLGITNPTPAQLAAALNGGTVTTASGTVAMAGILAQRQSGQGWGQIANAMGVTLGSVVSKSKTDKAGKKDAPILKAEESRSASSPGKSDQAHTSSNKGGNSSAGGGHGSSGSGSGSGGGGGGGGKSK